ncbi:Imm49 family immunity protein [uncultured Fibrella sp.]|uniref:Imm49 family immunity protein n=1 Tax=uncultured Fibrella sp. TaxID=1284596 RepID=UPI0035C9FC9D
MTYYDRTFTVEGRSLMPYLPDKSLYEELPIRVALSVILREKEALQIYGQVEIYYDDSFVAYTDRALACWHPLWKALCQNDAASLKSTLPSVLAFEQQEHRKAIDRNAWQVGDYIGDNTTPFSTGGVALYFERDRIEYLNLPFLQVLTHLLADNAVGFNHALQTALEKHRYYYECIEDDFGQQRNKPHGWVSLILTAACVLAQQRGIARTITSDYIPDWLIEGDFAGLPINWNI